MGLTFSYCSRGSGLTPLRMGLFGLGISPRTRWCSYGSRPTGRVVSLLLRAPQLLLMRRWRMRRLVLLSPRPVVVEFLVLTRVRSLVAVRGRLLRSWSGLGGLPSSLAK